MDFGILQIIIVLLLAGAFVLWGPEPLKTRVAELGGAAFLLWLLVKLVMVLLGRAS